MISTLERPAQPYAPEAQPYTTDQPHLAYAWPAYEQPSAEPFSWFGPTESLPAPTPAEVPVVPGPQYAQITAPQANPGTTTRRPKSHRAPVPPRPKDPYAAWLYDLQHGIPDEVDHDLTPPPVRSWQELGDTGQNRAIQNFLDAERHPATHSYTPPTVWASAPVRHVGRAAVIYPPVPSTQPARTAARQNSKSNPTFVPDAHDSAELHRMRHFFNGTGHSSEPSEPEKYRPRHRKETSFTRFMARGLGAAMLGGGTALAALQTYIQIRGR